MKEDRIRILFLLDKLTPAGTQTNVLELVRHLDRKRFDPRVIALLAGGELEKEFVAAGVRPIVLNVKSAYGPSGWKALAFLIRYLRQEKIEVIQTFFLHADILGTIAGKWAGVKRIYTTRRDEGFWRSPRQVFVNRFFNRFVDALLVNSEAVSDAVRKQENPAKPIYRIYNGVDSERFCPADVPAQKKIRQELGLSDHDVAVAVVAHMKHEIKGHSHLLNAVAEVSKKEKNFKVFLIGDGPLRLSLEAFAKDLGIGAVVRFLGRRTDTTHILKAMDVGCLPSLSEGFSNAVLEYMASGLAVVATRVGGNSEVIKNGTDGYLVQPGNPSAMAKRLVEFVNDHDLRVRFGKAAREKIVRDFSLEKMTSQYEHIFSSVRRKRVLYVIWSLDLGGAEQVVLNLVQSIDPKRFEPQVLCLNGKGRYAEVLERRGIKISAMNKRPKFDPLLIPRMVRFIKKERIDLIHTHLFTSNLWGRIAAWLSGVPVIATEHNQDIWKKPFHFFIDRVLFNATGKIIFVSKMVEQFYQSHLPSLNGKACVIYNGIDTGKFSGTNQAPLDLKKKFGFNDGSKVLGMVGRLVPQKGHVYFLDALNMLRTKGYKVCGLITGDGPMRDELHTYAYDHGLRNFVAFSGFRNDMENVYRAMDIFVLSSEYEGFPLVVLEAMAANIPIVATPVGGVVECLRDNENSLLVPFAERKQLADALEKLLVNESLGIGLAKTALREVQTRFSVEEMARQTENVYEEVLKK